LPAIAERARGSSPETSTTRLDGGDDLVDVVADDAEANVLGELLDDCEPRWKGVSSFSSPKLAERGRTSTESRLGSLGHHVGFVQDDELETGTVR